MFLCILAFRPSSHAAAQLSIVQAKGAIEQHVDLEPDEEAEVEDCVLRYLMFVCEARL